MKNLYKIILSGILALLLPFSESSQAIIDSENLPKKLNHQINSSLLKEKRELNVYLPTSYEESKRAYPVIYLLNASNFYYGDIENDSLWVINRLQRQHGIPESIIVLIESASWYQDVINNAEVFEQYLNQELVPYIDKKYRTLENRSLIGHSYAGAFVTRTASYEKNQFNFLLSLSPIYPSVDYVEEIQSKSSNEHSSKSVLQIYQGDEDARFISMIKQSIQANPKTSLQLKFEQIISEGHQSVLTSALSHGLRDYFHDFRMPDNRYILNHQLNELLITRYFEKRNKKYQVTLSEGELQNAITAAAQTYLDTKQFELAFSLWKKSQSKFKGYFMNMIAERFLSQRDTQSALIIWKKMTEILPEKSGSFAGLAKGYAALNKIDLAIQNYARAIELATKNKHPKLKSYQKILAELKKK